MDKKTNSIDSIQNQDSSMNHKSLSRQDSLKIIDEKITQLWREKIKKANFQPIYNERKYVVGKFADTIQTDTLYESYISLFTYRETCNSYNITNFEWDADKDVSNHENYLIMDTLISMICNANPRLMLKSTNSKIKTLFLNNDDLCQITGISYLINVGDINSDMKDEIAVLCHYIRIAGVISTCKIYSYQNEIWKNVLSFEVYGPQFHDNDPKLKIRDEIPGFLEKEAGIWYYHDYSWQGLESERRPLKQN